MDRAMQERLVGATILVLIAVLLIPWLLDGSTQPVGQHTSERELILPGTSGGGTETRVISLDAANRGGTVNSPPAVDPGTVKDVDANSASNERLPVPQSSSSVSDKIVSATEMPPKPIEQSSPPASSTTTASASTEPAESAAVATDSPNVAAANEPPPTMPEAVVEQASAATTAPPSDKPATTLATTPSEKSPPATFSTPMPTASPAADSALGWAVQVGSFARQENAERLAERLRDKKYKAFVMRNVVDGRVRFRVRVGPVKQRAEADLLATALTEDRQPVKVLRHP